MRGVEVHDRADGARILAVLRNKPERFGEDLADPVADERQADAHRNVDAAVDRVAVVHHAGRRARQPRRLLRVAGRDQPPRVDEDLPADLLGDGRAILRNAAAARRRHARPEVQIRRVLGGHAIAAPPEKAVLVGRVVEQRLRDVLRLEVLRILRQFERAQEEQRAVAVVVGGKRRAVVQGIAVDFAQHPADRLVGPALDRRAVPDADDLAQPSGVDLLQVVLWNFAHRNAPSVV